MLIVRADAADAIPQGGLRHLQNATQISLVSANCSIWETDTVGIGHNQSSNQGQQESQAQEPAAEAPYGLPPGIQSEGQELLERQSVGIATKEAGRRHCVTKLFFNEIRRKAFTQQLWKWAHNPLDPSPSRARQWCAVAAAADVLVALPEALSSRCRTYLPCGILDVCRTRGYTQFMLLYL